jgi:hypothetical protein
MRELMIAMGLISLAIGCGSGGGGGGGGSGGSVVAPNDGQWEIGLFELDTDCSNSPPSDPDTETDIADITMDVDGNGLTILSEDGSSMHFTLNGTTFESDDVSPPAPTPFHADGVNATFYVDQTFSVEFSSQTQGTSAFQADASCVGDDFVGVTFCETTDFPGWGSVPCTIINEAPMTAL